MVIATVVSMKKKTKGRKKIEIKKIQETNSRQVTFSKRRTGLFKKASELCVLTGAQIAIFVNSPGGRVFAFGHPNPNLLIDRYLNQNTTTRDHTTSAAVQNSQPPLLPMSQFNQHYMEVSRELEMEKKRGELIPGRSDDGLRWYEEGVDGMAVEELEQYLCSLEELKKKVLMRADELMMINKTPGWFGSNNVFDQIQMGWNNNNIQTMHIMTTNNSSSSTTVHGGFDFHDGGGEIGGFDFHHGGEIGRF
ncbi:hypothetical protein L6452_29634 [Arctium lappa]|uniref:Uncharacterized protein n=1 Tax=Arctium lappa TaxID=4217 RepID=A0ACB8ZI08_ARCLA|nr:hypothetical protein L6452_29634 [Arctium lappa]